VAGTGCITYHGPQARGDGAQAQREAGAVHSGLGGSSRGGNVLSCGGGIRRIAAPPTPGEAAALTTPGPAPPCHGAPMAAAAEVAALSALQAGGRPHAPAAGMLSGAAVWSGAAAKQGAQSLAVAQPAAEGLSALSPTSIRADNGTPSSPGVSAGRGGLQPLSPAVVDEGGQQAAAAAPITSAVPFLAPVPAAPQERAERADVAGCAAGGRGMRSAHASQHLHMQPTEGDLAPGAGAARAAAWAGAAGCQLVRELRQMLVELVANFRAAA
jgi:hypothetical protein